jgi:3-methylcrotonyl-CoA carboxylase alpha subunit/geranyl-CoA carboxylase alpha subunit
MTAIRRLLIANRGEIALRVMRTARRMGIETVAVYSDADAGAMHRYEATVSFALGGRASADSYLSIEKLLSAARTTGADAVHPGYGFLSENAEFAQAVINAGLTWVGPPPDAIRALGSKSAVKRLALQHDIPCLPGYFGEDQSDATLMREATRIGWPVMVKAAAGGGGRGMRLVTTADQFTAAVASARSEAKSSFGSDELVLERALLTPRHVEIQVFADAHGHCVHMAERDCSVQRRHQKIVEESPSPAVDTALRARMGQAAVALAQLAGYQGAGTVEFLLDTSSPTSGYAAADGSAQAKFYLMEMNTRLQVEHPVTEALTGLDLVEWQLRVAQGEPLPLAQEQIHLDGHAIEVRLCAEDAQFTPHAGTVLCFDAPATTSGVRMDHALASGTVVPPEYDSMLAKLIVHGHTRDDAIAKLRTALAQTVVLGLPTNRAMLAAVLDHPVFRAGDAGIVFLGEHGDALRQGLQDAERAALLPAALVLHYASQGAEPAAALPTPFTRPLRVRHGDAVLDLRLRETGLGLVEVEHAGIRHVAICTCLRAGTWQVGIDGAQTMLSAIEVPGSGWHVQAGHVDLWLHDASHAPATGPGLGQAAAELKAQFNGRVVAVHAEPGAKVSRGDVLLVIESMKIEHAVAAPRDVVVARIEVSAGQQVMPGQRLVSFEA